MTYQLLNQYGSQMSNFFKWIYFKVLKWKLVGEMPKIDKMILQRYDKIFEARNGLAVVPINGTGCGGCGAFVPPQIISEVRAKKNYHNCESCSRFLFWANE